MAQRYLTDPGLPALRIMHTLAPQSGGGVEFQGSQGRERCVDEVSRLVPGGVPAPDTENQSPGTAASQPDQRRVMGSPQGSHHGRTPCALVATAAGDELSRCLTPELCPEKASLPEPSPEYWRASLFSLYRMRDVAVQLRSEQTAAGADLRHRVAMASVIDTIDGWIASHQRRLSVIARRGGQGVQAVTS